jgi:BirA family biotin operon repressor/biotin-[acetyl-CoA-carboxylase] ligase
MTLAAEDLARTARRAPRLQIVARTGSTNTDLVAALTADASAWPHLSLWVTDEQVAGRGRLGRDWIAPAGAAIAASAVVDVSPLPPASRGWIPLLAGAAMARAVSAQLGAAHSVRVKWPNDVLVDGRKICGILAETVAGIDGVVVVGAGVNTTMDAATLPVATATSFAALGALCRVDELLDDYLRALDELCTALVGERGDAARAGVHGEIEALCATLGQSVRVLLPGDGELVGEAVRLGPTGELVVRSAIGETSVVAGDVVHVRPFGG